MPEINRKFDQIKETEKENKIAVMADIHGNLWALRSILDDIKKRGIKKTVCLGDVIGLGPKSKECLDLIIDNKIDMVLGNHELYALYGWNIDQSIAKEESRHHEWIRTNLTDRQIEFLRKQPLQIEINNILFEHFLLDQNQKYPFYKTGTINDQNFKEQISTINKRILFVGHEHRNTELFGKLIVVGSSGCTKNDTTSYYLVDLKNGTYEKICLKYDRILLEKALKAQDYPDRKTISDIFFGIDL